MKWTFVLAAVLATAAAVAVARADPGPADARPPETAPATAAAPCCTIPAGTPVQVELIETVSTRVQKPGETFSLRLAAPVIVNGVTVLRAGDLGLGRIVDIGRPGMGGRAGKLVLAAKYIEQDGVRVPLQSFRLEVTGKDNTRTALIISEAGVVVGGGLSIVALFVTGGEVVVPAGTRASAKVSTDATVVVTATSLPGPQATDPTTPSPVATAKEPTP